MNINKLYAFYKAAEYANITKAAEALNYTQSGISHMIRDLETEYGVPLLIRSKAGVEPTVEGRQLLSPIGAILGEYERLCQMIDDLHGLKTGVVNIGTFISVSVQWLPQIMKRFETQYPGIRLRPMEGDYVEIASWLSDRTVGCGFLTDFACPEDVAFLPLCRDRMMALLPKDSRWAGESKFPVEKCAEEAFIFPAEGFDADVRHVFETTGVRPNIKYTVRGDHTIISMVASGLGIGILPELFLQPHRQTVCVKELEPACSRVIGLALPSQQKLPPATEQFVQEVKRWIQENGGNVESLAEECNRKNGRRL